jgi:hypothetical protein
LATVINIAERVEGVAELGGVSSYLNAFHFRDCSVFPARRGSEEIAERCWGSTDLHSA